MPSNDHMAKTHLQMVTPIHQTTHPTTPIIELQLANTNTNIVEHKANHSISNSTNPVNYLHLIVMGAVVSILVHNLFDKPTMSRESFEKRKW